MVCIRGFIGYPGTPDERGLSYETNVDEPPVRDSNGVVSAVLTDDNESWWQNRCSSSDRREPANITNFGFNGGSGSLIPAPETNRFGLMPSPSS